jgi:transposase
MQLATTGRPAYHASTMLKIYLYGYLNRVPSSRRLERKAQRNVELIWLTGRLAPDGAVQSRLVFARAQLAQTHAPLPHD